MQLQGSGEMAERGCLGLRWALIVGGLGVIRGREGDLLLRAISWPATQPQRFEFAGDIAGV